jgi:hypothetical protein
MDNLIYNASKLPLLRKEPYSSIDMWLLKQHRREKAISLLVGPDS